MDDLSHWEFAEHFDGYDAAALILGYEPRESEAVQHQVNVVCDRMEMHYRCALEKAQYLMSQASWDVACDVSQLHDKDLPSLDMLRLWEEALSGHDDAPFIEWLNNARRHQFSNQKFSRGQIAVWLEAIGLKSRYPFSRGDRSSDHIGLVGRWPWGNHSTQMLEHLAAAAQRYYGANYDPNDATTVPTNATVSEWLQSDRKVSKSMADSIASMLRPDGLPTGPRK